MIAGNIESSILENAEIRDRELNADNEWLRTLQSGGPIHKPKPAVKRATPKYPVMVSSKQRRGIRHV